MKTRFHELDLLRLIAAFMVVMFHLCYAGPQERGIESVATWIEEISKYGFLGVHIFFMISGFVIMQSAEGKTWFQFAMSRAKRLYPSYWLCVTITFLALMAAGSAPELWQYAVNMTMIQKLFGVPDIDGVYWTLFIELKFYGLVFLVLCAGMQRYIEILLAAWLLAIALLPDSGAFSFFLFPKWAPYFIFGICCYRMTELKASPLSLLHMVLAFLSMAIALESQRLIYTIPQVTGRFQADTIGLIIFYGIICLFLPAMGFMSRLPAKIKTLIASLSALTYPLYLLHQEIGYIVVGYTGSTSAAIVVAVTGAWGVSKITEPKKNSAR